MARKKKQSPNAGMTVAEAGRRGGEATKQKYGSGFYSQIGQKGGQAVRDKGQQTRKADTPTCCRYHQQGGALRKACGTVDADPAEQGEG